MKSVIDAVIADHEQDGFWTILNAVKSRGPVPPPVVAVSERASVSDYLDALSAGAFEFFIWPIRSAEFVRIVDSAARKNIVQPRDTGGGLLFMPEPSTGRVGSSF